MFQFVLAAVAVLVQYPVNVSSSLLLNLNRRLTALISQLLILSRTALLQDQLSLPKQNTLQTWSTILLHFVRHGVPLFL